MSARGSTFKRCACEGTDGKPVGPSCPRLRGSRHGSWYYALRVPGRKHPLKKGGFATAKDAQAALDELKRRLDQGLEIRSRTTGEWLNEWLAGKRRLRPNTARSYAGHVDLYLKPHLGAVPLDRLRVGHVAAMFEAIAAGNGDRERPVGPATAQRIRATLRAALNGAVKQRLIDVNVASLVELPEAKRPPVRVWLPEHAGKFLDAIASDRQEALFHLVLAVGLRRGEVCGLRWVDVDLEAGHLRIAQQLVSVGGRVEIGDPKSATSVRVVALDAQTVSVLRAHRARQLAERLAFGEVWVDSGLVFTREDGSRLDPASVTRRFTRLAKAAGPPVIRLHDLRHSSASIGLASGESLHAIKERLGHSSITLTSDTYTHVSPALAREAASRRAALIPRAVRAQPDPVVPILCPSGLAQDQPDAY